MHVVQLMPLPLTVSCFSKIHIGFTFFGTGSPGYSRKKRSFKRVCLCVCVVATSCNSCGCRVSVEKCRCLGDRWLYQRLQVSHSASRSTAPQPTCSVSIPQSSCILVANCDVDGPTSVGVKGVASRSHMSDFLWLNSVHPAGKLSALWGPGHGKSASFIRDSLGWDL